MLHINKLKKWLIVFVCFILIFNMNLSVVVIAESLDSETGNEGDGSTEVEETISGPIEEVTTVEPTEEESTSGPIEEVTTVETMAVVTSIEISIEGTHFNESVIVNGEVEGFLDGAYDVTFTVLEGEVWVTDNQNISIVAGKWQHELDITSLSEGEFSLIATIDETDSLPVYFTVDRTAPTITIISPDALYTNKAVFEGTIDEEVSTVEFFLYDQESVEIVAFEFDPSAESPIEIEKEPFNFSIELEEIGLTGEDGFNFTIDSNIDEGQYSFSIMATDLAGNKSELMVIAGNEPELIGEVAFILDQTRPFISPASLFPAPNMTQVPILSEESEDILTISVKMIDDYELDENYDHNFGNAIIVIEKGSENPIAGTIDFDELGNETILTFTADDPTVWKSNQKYYVFVNPFLADNAGNLIHSRNWSFTTETDTEIESLHGNYLNNTNTCKTCHSAHTAPRPRLEGPNLELVIDPEEELDLEKESYTKVQDAVNGYCLACHDGSVGVRVDDHYAEGVKSDHNKSLINADGGIVSQSCGNCHDVHIASHPDNPNLLRDHVTYQHDLETIESDIDFYNSDGFVDSSEQLCETCHESNFFDVVFDEEDDLVEGVNYQLFSYLNRNSSFADPLTTFGRSEDYQLCLRCHNESYSEDYLNVVDIASFYSNENTSSGHFITDVKDGSQLNGHIPCSDCHESHSSENLSLIKNRLGHNKAGLDPKNNYNVNDNLSLFKTSGDEWTTENQRGFCISCHNNLTELYGITVKLSETDADEAVIEGHQSDSTESCDTCHGGASNTFREAAHAPLR